MKSETLRKIFHLIKGNWGVYRTARDAETLRVDVADIRALEKWIIQYELREIKEEECQHCLGVLTAAANALRNAGEDSIANGLSYVHTLLARLNTPPAANPEVEIKSGSIHTDWKTPVPKPPLGLRPRRIMRSQRISEIIDAMARYREALKEIPPEWIEELQELCSQPL
jgi:hypothetical protein